MGPCNSGYWSSPAASPVGANGRRRCGATQGRVPGGACSFPISVWSGTACLLNRLTRFARSCALLVPGIGKIHGQLLWSQEMWIKVAGRLGEALGHAWIFPTRPTGRRQGSRAVLGVISICRENAIPKMHIGCVLTYPPTVPTSWVRSYC